MLDPKDDISGLPDYPALQQLARALWRNGSVRGASVMVGAGLSKNAERPGEDTPAPPLWWELLADMIERLYPHNKTAAPSNPLRIAEEYRTYFGQAGLDDFIRSRFPDRSWSPGSLHAELLELPWMDVLTTNWDTLLERAAEETVEYTYEIVRTEADLTHARSPRIIKLHGSIGDVGPLIFAEEDYRTYPTKHAAFVNLARQVFIENELCLVGFSGDDPNFLQWAGWVRDQLGGSARRIYLVGNLRLESATRKYLETNNIAPIDLAPATEALPSKDQHAAATRIFLAELRKAMPAPVHEWKRAPMERFPLRQAGADIYQRVIKDNVVAAEFLEKTQSLLKIDRGAYPGWLVCPVQHRRLIHYGADENWIFRKPALDLLDVARRAAVVSEILWLRTIAFQPLGEQLVSAMTEMLEVNSSDIDISLRLEFAAALTRNARVTHDDDGLKRWAAFIEAEAAVDAPVRQEAQYQLCLRARDLMDFEAVAAGLALITSDDPVWQLRCAALGTEIGEYVKATRQIKDAAADLERRSRLDRGSLPIKSRLAWANWISRASVAGYFGGRAAPPRPREFKELDIDPLGEIEAIESKGRDIEKKRREEEATIEPTFDAGHYRDTGKDIHIGDADPGLSLLYEFDQLTEVSGLPIRINHVNICAEAAMAAVEAARQPTFEWYVWLLRALHSHLDGPFKRYFGRVAIAQIPPETAGLLIAALEKAVAFWMSRLQDARGPDLKDDRGRALDMLRLLLTALSRLTVRMSVERAGRTFSRAVELARDPVVSHNWLLDALGELAKYAAGAIPVAEQGALALSVIEFPLASEKGLPDRSWPRIVTAIWNSTPVRDPADMRWDSRVHQLIAETEKGQPAREEATLRLVYLALRNTLKPEEAAAFGRALWSDLDDQDNALPINAGILASTFAQLPAADGIDVQARLYARLFAVDLREFMAFPEVLDSRKIEGKLEHLTSLLNSRDAGLRMSADDAKRMFDEIIDWQPQELDRQDPFAASFAQSFNDGVLSRAGDLLTFVVVPTMRPEDRTEQRAQGLLDFITRTRCWRGLGALPPMVASAPSAIPDIVSAIRNGLVGSEFQHVGSAAMAIARWAKLVRDESLPELPRSMVDQLIATIETRQAPGLQAMLSATLALLKENFLAADDFDRLTTALSKIILEFRYEDVNLDSARAVSVSLIRAECVKLAVALKGQAAGEDRLQAWIDQARTDPLPEVRFSLINA